MEVLLFCVEKFVNLPDVIEPPQSLPQGTLSKVAP